MPAKKVSVTDAEEMTRELTAGTYAAVRFIHDQVVELWVADTHQDIEEAFEQIKSRPGKCELHQKAN